MTSTLFLRIAALATIACAVILSSCKKDDPVPVPVVSITEQPTTPAALTEGSVAGSLTVEATATEGATLSYQWYTNTSASNTGGTSISGANGKTYTLPTDLAAGTYYYFCEVSAEGAKSVRTSAVTVTVNAKPAPVITIATQPTAPADLIEGSIAGSLTVEATATEGVTLSYQWYTYDPETGELFEAIDGATSATYTLPTDLAAGTYYYFCEVSAEGAKPVRTSAVTVTVEPKEETPDPVPVITVDSQPTAPADLTEGSIAGSLTVEASATEGVTLSYQWYTNTTESNEGGTPIEGATSASYTLPADLAAGTYYYYCMVSAEGATPVQTDPVTVTVKAKDEPELTYTISASALSSFGSPDEGYTQPAARTVTITNTGTGTVTLTQPTATNYTIGTLSATELAAGETATFTVQPKTGLSAGTYNETITISGSNNATTSVSAQFAVTDPAPPPASTFIAVTNITGLPTAATAGTPLTLTGTVAPANATNKAITWSVTNAGETGATITGNTFNATAAGTATITATIANGTTESTPYTQNFTITVSAAAPSDPGFEGDINGWDGGNNGSGNATDD